MTQFTKEAEAKLRQKLEAQHIPRGIGTDEEACSIAMINLSLTGELTDNIPECMSRVIGRATMRLQDAIPDDMRNSKRYKAWLPHAARTGRDNEKERLAILMDWMWGTVLPQLQNVADEHGFGSAWKKMCKDRTYYAVSAASAAAAGRFGGCVYAAESAADADDLADAEVYSSAASAVFDAVYETFCAARTDDFWKRTDPIGVLERMTYLEEKK